MRKSDEIKNVFERSHDSNIGESLHDKILLWIYDRFGWDVDLICEITGRQDFIRLRRHIESPVVKRTHNYYSSTKSVVGVIDLMVEVTFRGEVFREICVEVKSKVDLGETIRQINYYKQFQRNNHIWIVCAPASPYAGVLQEQKIKFIEYKP